MQIFELFPKRDRAGQLPAAERTVAAASAYFQARAVVALRADRRGFSPLAARGIPDEVVKALLRLVGARRPDLESGRALSGKADELEKGLRGTFLLAPAIDEDELRGVLYVQTDAQGLEDPKDLAALGQFCRLLATALDDDAVRLPALSGLMQDGPLGDTEGRGLVALLEQHEWNIARVARELGTTRTTIYKRLERQGAERRRVPKTARRPTPA